MHLGPRKGAEAWPLRKPSNPNPALSLLVQRATTKRHTQRIRTRAPRIWMVMLVQMTVNRTNRPKAGTCLMHVRIVDGHPTSHWEGTKISQAQTRTPRSTDLGKGSATWWYPHTVRVDRRIRGGAFCKSFDLHSAPCSKFESIRFKIQSVAVTARSTSDDNHCGRANTLVLQNS